MFKRLKQGIGAYSKGDLRYRKSLCEIVIFSQTTVNRKGMGGQISEHTVEGYFWVFNLVESKNSLVGFSRLSDKLCKWR